MMKHFQCFRLVFIRGRSARSHHRPWTHQSFAPQTPLTYIRNGYSARDVPRKTAKTPPTPSTPSNPLTPAVLHILLALSTEERHGYGIMKQVETESQGKVKMGPGTLYGSLNRMIAAGLIDESDKKVDPKMDDERRVYYKITALGRAGLAAELERYREVVAVAKKKQLAPGFLAYGPVETRFSNKVKQESRNPGKLLLRCLVPGLLASCFIRRALAPGTGGVSTDYHGV
jgi:DNA-binding PadR family transcriptional regulator